MRLDYNCRGIVDFINFDAKNNPRIYICASGAGAGIQNYLWEVPGCSKYFIGASFPYATKEMDEFLGYKPEKYCSRKTAIQIAFESYYRAVDIKDCQFKNFNIGVGLTGVVASTREHKGGNRIFCSIVTNTEVHLFSVELKMATGFHARRNDGNVSDFLALYGIGKILGMNFSNADLEIIREYNIKHEIISNDEALEYLLEYPYWDPYNKRHPRKNGDWAIFPGAFNPVHFGHKNLVKEVVEKTHCNGVLYTISINSPHKPKLLVGDILRRSKLLEGVHRLFDNEPLYLDKVKNWPTKYFIIGSDALERLLDPKWGPNTEEVLEGFKKNQIKFFVSVRILNDTEITLDSIYKKYPIVKKYEYLFNLLETKTNISSTEIRNGLVKPMF